MTIMSLDVARLVGRRVEDLTLKERFAVSGWWAAFERYSPETLPLRRIEAMGTSAGDCVRQLAGRGLDPQLFEFILMTQPY